MRERQKIISITSWIAAVVAIAVTLLLPLGYFSVSYQYLVGGLDTEAEMTSRMVTELINANPEMWLYEQLRLEELLARRMRGNHNHKETRRIFDLKNRVIAENATELKPPLISRGFDLMDSGLIVGRLEIRTSLFPLLLRSALLALLGLSFGVGIFVALRVLPLRAVALAEKSLRESEDRYRRLVENAPNAILVYGKELFLYANSAALRLFGAERAEQLIGQPLMSIVHPEHRELVKDRLTLAEDANINSTHQELRLARFDGTPIDVAAVGIRIMYQGESATQVILHDITERKRLQDDLTDKVVLLEAALAKVKLLEGIIPICMYCNKIRDDKESWQHLEAYISKHSEAHFSHGICPECFQKANSEIEADLEKIKR
jgi:PAS domain S-box-containing protein